MKIKEKVQKATMTLEEHEHKKKTRIRKFLTISLIIFSIITALSFLFFTSCTDDVCNTDYIKVINVIIIGFGIIGLVYCFFILKDFNTTIDDKILPDYNQILLDEELIDKETLEHEKDKDNKKLICF
jgi:hypothetical protein